MPNTVLIAGAGQAAAQTVISLRHVGFLGRIVLVGEEPYLPYQRPPLSKKFLAGELELDRLFLRHEHFYRDNQVELRLGVRVERIDTGRKVAVLGDSTEISYDRLLLATGSKVRKVTVPGHDLPQVHYLRSVGDVQGIQPRFTRGRHLVVVGGGYIGLEVAAVAVTAGLKVTVVEMLDRVMARVVAPPISEFYLNAHKQAGVEFRLGTGVTEFRADGEQARVICSNGESLPADLIVVGVGVLPATDLAEGAGIKCDNGILVDENCQTSDPAIFAAGDCTNHPNRLLGRRLRLECVQNAQEQGKCAARAIVGAPEPYAQIPWFWSDQYDLKLQMTGLAENYSQITLRGDPAQRSFAAFYFADGRLIAVHAINSPREFMLSKKLIAQGAHLDPAAVADVRIPFKELADAAAA